MARSSSGGSLSRLSELQRVEAETPGFSARGFMPETDRDHSLGGILHSKIKYNFAAIV